MSLVIIDDHAILHALRDKAKQDRTLTLQELQSIPDHFESGRWFRDLYDPAVLLCWERLGDVWVKIVIKLDRQMIEMRGPKGGVNVISTGGAVSLRENLELNIKEYQEIK